MNTPTSSSTPPPVLLACFALEAESIAISLPGLRVLRLVTGMGKVRAAIRLTKALAELRPAAVINIGTAGTTGHAVGDIIAGRRFIDRDHAGLGLPGLEYEWNTEKSPLLPELPSIVNGRATDESFTINTGDDFVTDTLHMEGDAIDMEAAAEAMACLEAGIPFVSVKYITDIVGQNSVRQWEEKLAEARTALAAYFARL